MDLKLKGKTALVTGGSEGIGKGIALALAKEGVDVAICARRKEPLEAAAAEIAKATGRKIVPIAADLRQDKDAKNFVEQGHKALGRVDIMVNNAGSAAGGVIEHLTEDDWEKGLQLKFMGYVRCLRYVLPIMVKQGGGRVVNLIGNDGVKPSYWEICPGAANAAGQNLTLSLAGAIRQRRHQLRRGQSGAGAHRALGRPGRRHGARHENPARRSRQTRAGLDPHGPYRRSRGSGQSRRHAGVAADADGQRHHDRDRRRPGQAADGPLPRPSKDLSSHSCGAFAPDRRR